MNTKKFRKVRTLADCIKDPRVVDHSDERDGRVGGDDHDGIWLTLADGYENREMETRTVHEYTVARLCEALNTQVFETENV